MSIGKLDKTNALFTSYDISGIQRGTGQSTESAAFGRVSAAASQISGSGLVSSRNYEDATNVAVAVDPHPSPFVVLDGHVMVLGPRPQIVVSAIAAPASEITGHRDY